MLAALAARFHVLLMRATGGMLAALAAGFGPALLRVLPRLRRALMSTSTVRVRLLGVIAGALMIAHLVMIGSLPVVMRGRFVVARSLMVVPARLATLTPCLHMLFMRSAVCVLCHTIYSFCMRGCPSRAAARPARVAQQACLTVPYAGVEETCLAE